MEKFDKTICIHSRNLWKRYPCPVHNAYSQIFSHDVCKRMSVDTFIAVQLTTLYRFQIIIEQEKPTNCGTEAADVLDNFLAGKI